MGPDVGLVNEYKLNRSDPWHRVAIGLLYNHFARWSFGVRIRDVDCDFRLIRREALDHAMLQSTSGTTASGTVRLVTQSVERSADRSAPLSPASRTVPVLPGLRAGYYLPPTHDAALEIGGPSGSTGATSATVPCPVARWSSSPRRSPAHRYQHESHAFRELVGLLKGRQVTDGLGVEDHDVRPMPGLRTPRSAKRIRCAGSAVNLRMASSGRASYPRAHTCEESWERTVGAWMRMFLASRPSGAAPGESLQTATQGCCSASVTSGSLIMNRATSVKASSSMSRSKIVSMGSLFQLAISAMRLAL